MSSNDTISPADSASRRCSRLCTCVARSRFSLLSSKHSEASGRGSRQVVFGEVTYTSTDPWSVYTSNGRDYHPMLLELRRMMSQAYRSLMKLRLVMLVLWSWSQGSMLE